jgi:hypothetical protein
MIGRHEMQAARMSAAAALVAVGAAVAACGSKDATGPAISLSLEEVRGLASELSGAMNAMNVNFRTGGSSVFSIVPGPSFSVTGQINTTVSCPGGGTASAAGTSGGTTTLTADVTLTYTNCKTAHYLTNGSVHATGNGTTTATSASGQSTAQGTLKVTASDGRSGTCAIDLSASASMTQTSQPTYTVSGSACGANVSGRY